jgi:hypothetical protein
MTAQKGKDLLLKVDSDGEGDFTTVAGLRARTLAFNAGRSTLASLSEVAPARLPLARRRLSPRNKGALPMNSITWILTGGFAKGYRTQILGVTAALSAIGLWAVGDMRLSDSSPRSLSCSAGSASRRSAPRSTMRRARIPLTRTRAKRQ